MHYVTEDELREAYAKEPFARFEPAAGDRLTPSARQFLIDFRIDFPDDETRSVLHVEKESTVVVEQCVETSALVDDAHRLAMKLRLLARKSLGICNKVARDAELLGTTWATYASLSDLAPVDSEIPDAPYVPGPPPLPPFSAAVHPVFFEMACMHEEIGHCARIWYGARKRLEPEAQRAVAVWLAEACGMCRLLEEAIDEAGSEV